MAFHFRHGQEDAGARTRQLSAMAQQLTAIATSNHIAVGFAVFLSLFPLS
jgi:hypothetical protein